MPKRIGKSAPASRERYGKRHRLEHWYVSNQVYFITARCRDKFSAFASQRAKQIFWDRFDFYTDKYVFTPWVVSLLDNHYHVLGYCKEGKLLGEMMRRRPFWTQRGAGHGDYFDGCIRDEKQCRLAYRYTLTQSVRHGICTDWRQYPHTHVNIELERGLQRAIQLDAFMREVPYPRYRRRG